MKKKLSVLCTAIMLLSACNSTTSLPRADKAACDAVRSACDSCFQYVSGFGASEAHSLMVLQDGKVLYEHYNLGHDASELHELWSASKTFTATAIGFAVQDGLLSVDDKVVSFFSADELPSERHPYLEQLTLWHLLTMSSGFKFDILRVDGSRFFVHDWTRSQLASDFSFEPGTKYYYHSGNTFLLSAILQRVTGERLDKYLEHKLFQPLGITRYQYEISPDGVAAGGWGLYLTLEDLAKMGQFMLQKGSWNGRQILDSAWFDEAMKVQIMQYDVKTATPEDLERYRTNESRQGYGYQMWACTHGAWRLDGAHGQYCVIIPEKNAVIAAFNESDTPKRDLAAYWRYIYPAL